MKDGTERGDGRDGPETEGRFATTGRPDQDNPNSISQVFSGWSSKPNFASRSSLFFQANSEHVLNLILNQIET
jgi:hypothetical protein